MIHYILTKDDGDVVQRGTCRSQREIPLVDGLTAQVVDASDPRRPATHKQQTAMEYRRMQYPSVGDQLDALWKAIAPLIEHPEAEAILAKIQAVKDANPKPSN